MVQLVRTPPCHGGGRGFESRPGRFFFLICADVAQLAEQLICNQQVIGSSPIIGSEGWFPERPKGTDCKSAADSFGGSNPPPSIPSVVTEGLLLSRGRAVWKLVGLITRRSQVQILSPLLRRVS